MNEFNVGDNVKFHSTSDSTLDTAEAVVMGFYGEDGVIVAFTGPRPAGYNPAIVITKYCLKKV